MSVSVRHGAVYPPLKINRNRGTSERSARLQPAILTGNRMEERHRRWPTAKQAIIIHLQDVCHSQHSLRPQIVLWCLTWITGNCCTWKQLSHCFILTLLSSSLSSHLFSFNFPSSVSHVLTFPSLHCFFPSLPILFHPVFVLFFISPPFFLVFLLLYYSCLFSPHSFLSLMCFFPFPSCPFCLIPVFTVHSHFLSFRLYFTFPPATSFLPCPFLFVPSLIFSFLFSTVLIFILQRSSLIGRAFKKQYQEIKLVLLLFWYYDSLYVCAYVCVSDPSLSTPERVHRLRQCVVCLCVRTCPAVAGALLPARRRCGHSPKWIHQALPLPLCVVSSHSRLHQHMQIQSALMSLLVYIMHGEWINCGSLGWSSVSWHCLYNVLTSDTGYLLLNSAHFSQAECINIYLKSLISDVSTLQTGAAVLRHMQFA